MSAGQLEVDDRHGTQADAAPSGATTFVLSPAERRVAEALLRCVARWGLAKTTIEDLAREAGVSRATVYRLVPGGKQAVLYVAVPDGAASAGTPWRSSTSSSCPADIGVPPGARRGPSGAVPDQM